MPSDHDRLGCETCTMAPPDPHRWTYTDYVCFLRSHGFHNLACLDDYLRWGVEASRNPAVPRPQRATSILLEFGASSFRTSDMSDTTKLRVLLKEWTRKSPSTPPAPSGAQGRIIMVNNISPEMVDTLGGLLNIEPAFFASHLADHGIGSSGEVNTSSPLASQNLRHQKQFFTIEYPCAFVTQNCGKDVDIDKLYCKGNYRRKVEVCSKYGKQKVALARRKISFYMKKTLDPWLCKFNLLLALRRLCLKTPQLLINADHIQVLSWSIHQSHTLHSGLRPRLEHSHRHKGSKSPGIREDISISSQ